MEFYSGDYTALSVFPAVEPDETAEIYLKNGTRMQRKRGGRFAHLLFSLEKDSAYTIETGGAEIGLAYLHGGEGILECGVKFLPAPKGTYPLHFIPVQGYFGGPAALCYQAGYYHLFYMWNPFSEGDEMVYWGHAAGKEITDLKPLPLALFPPEELRYTRYRHGGAYRGAAEAENGQMQLYFSRRLTDRAGQNISSCISKVQSRDLIHFSDEIPLRYIEAGYGPGIRGENMVLGDYKGERGVVELYQKRQGVWERQGTLLRTDIKEPVQCADFFPQGRSHVVLAASARGESRWYRGTFSGKHLRIRNRGVLSYGEWDVPQTFWDGEKQILFGRIAGRVLSMPRHITSRGGMLYTKPIDAVYEKFEEGEKGDAFYIQLLRREKEFSARVGAITLRGTPEALWVETDGRRWELPIFAERLEIFIDGDIVEIFLNDGQASVSFALPLWEKEPAIFAEGLEAKRYVYRKR